MIWYPLQLTTPVRHHLFGGRMIQERLGRHDVGEGTLAETWEISDVDGDIATITNGAFAGRTLREVTLQYPNEIVAPGWSGPRFPLLTKFIDGSGMLPVHVHADDATARAKYNEPNGKTEAWHILWADRNATFLGGVKPGMHRAELREALLNQDYDRALVRLPLRAGETVYVPAGTIHSFGPGTLIYEVEQTSNIQEHAMPHRMEDGQELSRDEWEKNADALLDQLHWESQPHVSPGAITESDDAIRCRCCTGPYFTLERITLRKASPLAFDGAIVLTNLGDNLTLEAHGVAESIKPAATVLLPAACSLVEIGPEAEFLLSYLPETSVRLTCLETADIMG